MHGGVGKAWTRNSRGLKDTISFRKGRGWIARSLLGEVSEKVSLRKAGMNTEILPFKK